MIVLAANAAVTPAGKPTAAPMPVARVVAWVIAVRGVLIHSVGVVDGRPTVIFAVTVIVPVALTTPQPPVSGIVYLNTPAAVGVPLIVIVLAAKAAVTPAGKPTAAPMPVASVVAWVIAVRGVLIHSVGVVDGSPAVMFAVTVIVPVALTTPQPPVSGIVYSNTPAAVGVPLIVIVLAAKAAVTPAGKPTAAPMPVARVVAWVIGVRGVLIHSVGVVDGRPAVIFAVTVIVPVALTTPQPPVSGIV